MAVYEIQNYIKMICIRIDHFESHIVDEMNCHEIDKIEEFINRYKDRSGLKVIIIQMNDMEIITFDDVKKFIKNAHVFDYIRYLADSGHKMLTADEDNINLGVLVKYMLETK